MAFKHLKEQRMTYWQHFFHANKFVLLFLKGATLTFMHSVYPDLFDKGATNAIEDLKKHHSKHSNHSEDS